MVGEKAVVVLEHVTRLRTTWGDVAQAAETAATASRSRRTHLHARSPTHGTDGDHNTAPQGHGDAIVNAVLRDRGRSGLITALDLP